MTALIFLIHTCFSLYLSVVLIRLWLQWVQADFYNPFCQFIARLTTPVISPLQKILPTLRTFDTATFLFACLLATIYFLFRNILTVSTISYAGIAISATLFVIKQFGFLIFWFLIARAILSWVSQGNSPFEAVLYQLTEPLLSPIRRLLPSMGGLDLSILILFIGLQALNYLLSDLLPGIWPYL